MMAATRAFLLFVLSLPSAQGTAEPDAKVQWLMDEPVSLFDFGIYELREYLEDQEHRVVRLGLSPTQLVAYYVWEENRIYIVASTVDDAPKDDISTWCASVFDRLVAITLAPYPHYMMFSHHGYTTAGEPTDLKEHLRSLTILVAMAPISENGERTNAKGICERPFARENFSFRRDRLDWWPGAK